MKSWKLIYLIVAMTLQAQQAPMAAPASVPLYRVTLEQSSAKAINYRYMKSSTKIDFKGTALAPTASGMAKVSSEATTTQIKAKFEGLPDPTQFGPEYLTYVLWAISPEGRAANLGEILLKKGHGKVEVTEPLQSFGLVVTAEPYFAVAQPSNVVVMENAAAPTTWTRLRPQACPWTRRPPSKSMRPATPSPSPWPKAPRPTPPMPSPRPRAS